MVLRVILVTLVLKVKLEKKEKLVLKVMPVRLA